MSISTAGPDIYKFEYPINLEQAQFDVGQTQNVIVWASESMAKSKMAKNKKVWSRFTRAKRPSCFAFTLYVVTVVT